MRAERLAVGAVVLALAGCGGGGATDTQTSKEKRDARTDADVIRAWSDAVREGDYPAANALFAVPATIANPAPRLRITKRADINRFNRSLPCGAELVDTQTANGGYVRATFELVEGADGTPCAGPAEVSFRIEDGRITEWLREGDEPPPGSTEV